MIPSINSDHEKQRLKALRNYKLLDTLPEAEFDRLTELASLICDVPISLISLIDENRQWFKSKHGLDTNETPREYSFCNHVIQQPGIFEIKDATADVRFAQNPLVTGDPEIRFYAGYPLIDNKGLALGALCVIDRVPKELNDKQKRALQLLADEVMALITQQRRKEELKVSENRFRSFFENSQGLMCTHDMSGRFLSVNVAGAALIGYSVKELRSMTLYDLVPEKYHFGMNMYLDEMKVHGKSSGLMITNHKDGGQMIWMYNNIMEKDVDGNDYVIGNSIDITAQHHIEKDLTRTKQLLEQINRVSNIGGWEYNVKKGSLYWSAITKQIHEVDDDFSPVSATAINFFKEGSNRDEISSKFETLIKNGQPYDVELQLTTAKNNTIWVRAIGQAEFKNGTCKRAFGTIQNIDKQKKMEIALEASENKYRAFFESSPVGISVNEYGGKFLEGNQALYDITGYTEEEYRKLGYKDITPAEYLEDQDKNRELLAKIGRYGPFEKEYIHKNGHRIPILLNGMLFEGEAGMQKVYSVIQDISELKKAQEAIASERSRLEAFVRHAPAAVAMFDKHLNYIAASNRWAEEYHITDRKIIGECHYNIFPNITQQWRDIHARCLAGAVEKNDEDVWRPDGWDQDQFLRWEVRPWYLLNGSVGGLMMFTQDITETIRQREELENAKLLAEQASISKSEFLANMSHEIRTPLNGVIGFTDLVLKTKLDETQQQYLSIVNQSATALLSIINDILDFSKIEAGKLELDIVRADLFELGSQSADIITYHVQKKGLEMLLNISTDLPRFIWADDVRLKQILLNLLGNASKFTEKGEIELRIRPLTDVSQENITVRFEVRDTGIGIHPAKQSKIFEAFSQEDSSTTKKYGGTGLGLTISNKLLALMGSRLEIASTPGIGSTFYFDIAFKTEKGEPAKWENIDTVKKVLIVDDNDNNRIILRDMLKLKNIISEEAKSGTEAMEMIESGNKYDAVLMDYHMPEMDGLETIKKLREKFSSGNQEQPVILLHSSSDDETLIKACEDLQVSQRLVKPLKINQVFDSLSKLLRKEVTRTAKKNTFGVERNMDVIRVLITDDNPINMVLAKTIVKKIAPNAVILQASNGLEAVNKWQTDNPDIILMDIQMPEMNGYEATIKIRELENGKHTPIVALTAGSVKGEKEKCLSIGMDDFITKPFVEAAIVDLFERWINFKSVKEKTFVEEEKSADAHFDIAKIKKLIDNDAIINNMLELTIKELKRASGVLQQNFAEKNVHKLNYIGHNLFGTSSSAGLTQLCDLAHDFEYLKEFNEEKVQLMLNKTLQEIDKVTELIIQRLNSNK